MIKLLGRSALARLVLFRKEVSTLYRAFRDPLTPTYLKLATALVALYVISPIDLIPDFIPLLGWVDDVVLVSMAVSWIVSRLPVAATVKTTYRRV